MNNFNEQGHSRRQWLNRIMLGLSGTAAAVAILILALILGYTLVRGISDLNLSILTQAAKPMGQTGGGIGLGNDGVEDVIHHGAGEVSV